MPKINAPTVAEHRAETHDALLEAWGALVLERGYDEVSLSHVAKAVGLARTAVYNYFPDREAIFLAWTDREVERTMVALEKELADATNVVDKLTVFIRIELESFKNSHLQPGREIVHLMGPDAFARIMEHIAPVERILAGILEEGIASGAFTGVDADEVLPLTMATIGAERGPLAAGTVEVDEANDRVTRFLLRALGAT